MTRRDADIRGRLARGDEDSVVNLLLFGTTFTSQPRVTAGDLKAHGADVATLRIVQQRLDDMVVGIASPGANERLRFARTVLESAGLTPTTAAGREETRRYLQRIVSRAMSESEAYDRIVGALAELGDPLARLHESGRLYRDRGLSTDARILPNFAIEQALAAIKAEGTAAPRSIKRVAIVGPGLDFIDKAEGYDFYPPQTIQPFGAIDSLTRLNLAKPDDLRVTTLDISARVNDHIEAAGKRSRSGAGYLIHLPLKTTVQWSPELLAYWAQFGDRIGQHAKSAATPKAGEEIILRAVRVEPAIVGRIAYRDLDVVLQRLEPLPPDERFDLIIATNVLVYYDVFEQSLAAMNISTMLRPGGLFLVNHSILGMHAVPLEAVGHTDAPYWPGVAERVIWYQRR